MAFIKSLIISPGAVKTFPKLEIALKSGNTTRLWKSLAYWGFKKLILNSFLHRRCNLSVENDLSYTFCPGGATPDFEFIFSSILIRKFTPALFCAKGLSLRDKASFGNLILQIGYTSGVRSCSKMIPGISVRQVKLFQSLKSLLKSGNTARLWKSLAYWGFKKLILNSFLHRRCNLSVENNLLTFCPGGATPDFEFIFSSILIRKFTPALFCAKGLSLRDKASFGNLILQIGF